MNSFTSNRPAQPEWLELIRQKVESLTYGIVQIIVHEGKITQIERTEKTRLDSVKDDENRRMGR